MTMDMDPRPTGSSAAASDDDAEGPTSYQRLLREAVAMVGWAGSHGKTPSEFSVLVIDDLERRGSMSPQFEERELLVRLVRAHRDLSILVRPARPALIRELYDQGERRMQARKLRRIYLSLGPLPVVRNLVLLALGFLILFVQLAASANVRSLTAH